MPLATKNGSLIVKSGSIAEDCNCCGCYSLFEWIDDPPPTSMPAFGSAGDPRSSRDNEPGFCVCYWKPGIALTCNASTAVIAGESVRFEGYLPKGGALHSRVPAKVSNSTGFGVLDENAVDRSGSLSGLAATVGGSPGSLSVSAIADAPARIVATDSSLFLFPPPTPLAFPPQPASVRIGLHASGLNGGVLEGATISNQFTGTGSYRYRIVRQTEQQFVDSVNATTGRSLKDCGGNDLWTVPWTAEFQWPAIAPTSQEEIPWRGEGDFSNVEYEWFFRNAFQRPTRFTMDASLVVPSSGGRKLAYRKPPSPPLDLSTVPLQQWVLDSPFFFDVCVGNNGPVAPFNFGTFFYQTQHPGGVACTGCQTRYNVSGILRRLFVQTISNPLNQNSLFWYDTLYFDNVLTACFDSVSSVSFTVAPTRRDLQSNHLAAPYRYGSNQSLGSLGDCSVAVVIKNDY